MRDTWLVTGGAGFIGANIAGALVADGVNVVVADTLARAGGEKNVAWLTELARKPGAGRFEHRRVDVRQEAAVDELVASLADRLQAVAHLAGQVAMTTSIQNPRLDFETNTLGTFNMLEALRRHAKDVPIAYSSSNKVYGGLADFECVETPARWTARGAERGIGTEARLSFESPYGCSKGAADQYILDYHRIYGLQTIVFRHSSVYGGRQFATFDQGWIGWFCGEALRQKAEAASGREVTPFTISGDGKQVRDVLHADDVVRCYRAAMARVDRCVGRAFNIGGGPENSLSLLELFARIESLTGHQPVFERLPARPSDQRFFVADNREATEAFGWQPEIGCEEGLRRMLAWVGEAMPLRASS